MSDVQFPLHQIASIAKAGDSKREVYAWIEGEIQALQGKDAHTVVDTILPQIDGFATSEEIIAAAAPGAAVPPDWVENVLHWLVEVGLCVKDREEPGDRPLRQHFLAQIRHFARHISFPTLCQKRLQASRVVVINLEYVGTCLVQHLAAAGVGHLRGVGTPQLFMSEVPCVGGASGQRRGASRHALLAHDLANLHFPAQYEGVDILPGEPFDWQALISDCDLAVLVLPRWQSSLVRGFNRAALALKIPFLPVWFEETRAHLGPLVVPYETACLQCVELRRRSHWTREDFREIQQQHAEALGPLWTENRFLIPWVPLIASLASCEIVTAIAQHQQPASRGHELSFDAHTWESQRTPVLKMPRCPACGRMRDTPSLQPFALQARETPIDAS